MTPLLYVGCYGAGITVYERHGARLIARHQVPTPDPSYLVADWSRGTLYACNELTDHTVSGFAVDPERGLRALGGSQPTGGTLPCHLLLHPAGYLMAANYGSGSVSVHPVRDDGSLAPRTDLVQHAGHGADPERQEGPHAHQVRLAGDRVVVVDLGLDELVGYDFDAGTGRLTRSGPPFARTSPGTGPRHAVAHPSGHWYVAGELASTVSVFRLDGPALRLVGEVPASGAGHPENYPAGIALSRDGHRLYLSNRGANTIATFEVRADGSLLALAEVPTGGDWPRHFAIVDDLLLVANQNSNSLTGLRLDGRTGVPGPPGVLAETGSPTCVLPG